MNSNTNGTPPLPEDITINREKSVNSCKPRRPPKLVAITAGALITSAQRSILTKNIPLSRTTDHKPNTLLEKPTLIQVELLPWKKTRNEFIKLSLAADPLYWMAQKRGWELKIFTLILNAKLSSRLDNGDLPAWNHIRDEMTRRIPATLGGQAEFLYAIEKAPLALADKSSRRRWHLHGLIIGPSGFSAQGKTELRKKLRSLKGEADADLCFNDPGKGIDYNPLTATRRWTVYMAKNGLTLQHDPSLANEYDLPPGKQTYISINLKREAARWNDGRIAGLTTIELIESDRQGLYKPL